MKKKLYLLILIGLFITKIQAQDLSLTWAKGIGGTMNDQGKSIAVDATGNVYTTGIFSGTVDFDPSTIVINLTSTGLTDIFITKQDPMGNLVWAKTMGGTSDDVSNAIFIDIIGNIYITGSFKNIVDFDPNSGIVNITSIGASDIFITKLDVNGSLVWAKAMGGIGDDMGTSLAVDANGSVYTIGQFIDIVDFDPNIGSVTLISAGNLDIFISKLDASGNFVWAKAMGGINNEFGQSIAIDTIGNIYITGIFSGTVDFDPNIIVANLISAGITDTFITKLDATGNLIWAKSIGGLGFDQSYSITLDASNNVYTTGYFSGTADFDPSIGVTSLTSNGFEDIFISKLDASGNFIWAKAMGG